MASERGELGVDRGSPFGREQGPSFDNFGELVAALKLQFLQGVPPTAENVNRATQAAIQQVSQGVNPDAGATVPAQLDASGGAGDGGVSAPSAQPPSPLDGLPFDRPPDPQTAPLAPQRPGTPDADTLGGIPAGPEDGGGLAGALGASGIGVAALLAQAFLNRPEQGSATGREASRTALIAGEQPRLGLPAPDARPPIIPPNEASGPARRAGAPDPTLAIEDLREVPIGQESSANAADRPVTTGADRSAGVGQPTKEQTARATQVAEAAVPPGTVPTPDEIRAATPLDLSTQGIIGEGGSSSRTNSQLLVTLQETLFGSVIGIENLSDKQLIELMEALAIANDANATANPGARVNTGANVSGSVLEQTKFAPPALATSNEQPLTREGILDSFNADPTRKPSNEELRILFLKRAKKSALKGLRSVR